MPRWPLVLVPLLLAGCTGASGGGDGTTTSLDPLVTVEATTTAQPTTTSATNFEIPPEIDLPYVQRVLKTIYHLDGEATRHLYAKKVPDAELYERLEAIFGGSRLVSAKRILGESAFARFPNYAEPPGDATIRVVDLLQVAQGCMVVLADLDYGPQFKNPPPLGSQSILQLRRAEILPFNPTGWGVVFAGETAAGKNVRICE